MAGAAAGLGGAAAGGNLMAGLSEVFERFSGPEHQAKAHSRVGTGQKKPCARRADRTLDADTITALLEKTTLNRSDL